MTHSEFNASKTEAVKLFQIWLYPDKENVNPRYDQLSLNISDRKNKLQTIVSPDTEKSGLWIHQQAWLSMGNFEKDKNTSYKIKKEGNGVYAMVVKGEFEINNNVLYERDAIGLWNTSEINFIAKTEGAEILLLDIPMQLN
ncbi:MAG TPA: hypothetical protein PKX84_10965 [Bacteroidia bacterium]|nr:hypothetical protein [Bacteroidia bacterium]